MKAKKSYGQHFLKDIAIAQNIANGLVHTQHYQKILEVGPGQGMLTQFLMEREEDLMVVEADRDMVLHLKKHYPELKDKIIAADFLKLKLELFFKEEPFALIGNFPYNISSQILFKMLEYKRQIPELVGMFQKEVAERIIAGPGSKTYGVISVLIQAFYEGEYLFTVDKSSFIPPPKVQSGVIRLVRKAKQELDCDETLFRQVVKIAFSQRRKMLRNTMKSFLEKTDPLLQDPFFNQRPEQLSVSDFVKLSNWISERKMD